MNDVARSTRLSPTPQLLGGALCLDFANTVDAGRTASPHERLFDYGDLLTWARHAGILSEEQHAKLRALIDADADATQAAFRQAIDLREAIFRVFAALADGTEVAASDLAHLQQRYLEALGQGRLLRHESSFDWTWDAGAEAPEQMLWPIAYSAVELLTSPTLDRVKICASGTCRWLFVDASKNAARRWCSMADCGSRAKMRRQYARRRAALSRS